MQKTLISIGKIISLCIGMVILGAFGALLFNIFLLPYMIASPFFENFQFVKDLKNEKIVVNPKETVYVQENASMQDAILNAEKSVVNIQSASSLKSGFIATSDGLIVTLASVIGNGTAKVFLDGSLVPFKVVTIDHNNNLALIKIDKDNLQTVKFADDQKIKLGQEVFLVAATLSTQEIWLANQGIVREIDPQRIKTNISGEPIAVGGPLFNSIGELVGINDIDSGGKISAVSVEKVKALLGL